MPYHLFLSSSLFCCSFDFFAHYKGELHHISGVTRSSPEDMSSYVKITVPIVHLPMTCQKDPRSFPNSTAY